MLDTNLTFVNSRIYNITKQDTTRFLFYADKNSRLNIMEGTIIEDI